ncbi:tRNA (guanosine(46)-N7)-methyltransferase TrmB [Gammaproteobacteria bacterium]|nr:tRNA (guanosine(46)-N7)-methyltransferase TrmB [Gammaproteobacteria bacterium]
MHNKFLPSFVQRKGRITKSQEDNLYNLHSHQTTSHAQILSEKDNYKEIILEIGFGNGESLINLALDNPHNLYIGSEVYMAGIGQVLGAIRDNELTNVRLITGDIRLFLDKINQPIFDVVLIICPDPWPKLKHHKRRMINSEFLDLTHKVLKLSGHLFISTDWENYAESIEESINQNLTFEVITSSPYEHLKLTKFQKRAIEEGRKIYSFSLKKIS